MRPVLPSLVLALLVTGCAVGNNPRPILMPPPPRAATARAPVNRMPATTQPAVAPAPAASTSLVGAWTSRAFAGNGVAGLRELRMIFNEDGTYFALLEIDRSERPSAKGHSSLEGARLLTTRGRWAREDGRIVIHYDDGRQRSFPVRFSGNDLVLTDSAANVVLGRRTS